MLLIAVLLAAAPATPASQEVLLTDEPQVRDLCAALRADEPSRDADPAEQEQLRGEAQTRRTEALAKSYRVEVPSKGFSFGRFVPNDNRLELDGDRPLKAADGALTLDLDGIDDVAFDARPEQVSAWSKAKKAGTLKLVVVFKPSDRCAGNPQAQAFRLSGHAQSWQLVDANGPVASADGEGEPTGAVAPKSARIEKVTMQTEAPAPDDGKQRISGVQSALERCASQSKRSGNVVVQFHVSAGKVQNPQVILDSVRDDAVARCVAHALAGAAISGAKAGQGTASIALQ